MKPKQWTLDTDKELGLMDIIPLNDLFEHIYGEACPCNPRIDGKLTVHNSLDNREEIEEICGNAWIC